MYISTMSIWYSQPRRFPLGGEEIQHETKGKGKKRFELLLASMGNKYKEKRVHSFIQIDHGTDPSTSVLGEKISCRSQIIYSDLVEKGEFLSNSCSIASALITILH